MFQARKNVSLVARLALLLVAADPACSLFHSQRLVGVHSGPQVVTFFSDVDDTDQPYGLYLPKNFDAAKKYPLVMMLHGAGSNHRLDLRRVFGKSNLSGETDVEATRYFPEWRDVDYIVVAPFARGTMGYQGVAEKDVHDVLADVKKRFLIDEDRLYLTGLSMGGGGALWIGLTHPDLWAAIAPVCPAQPDGVVDLAPNALNVPVHLFQGDADKSVDPQRTRELAKRLKELGTEVEYTEYPGVGHNSWENAYRDAAIFDWFAKFRRNRHPDRVRFSTRSYQYRVAYWAQIDELRPGTWARVDAKFTGPNRLEIASSDLTALTLRLAGHPKFRASAPLNLIINGKALEWQTQDLLSLSKDPKGDWIVALAPIEKAAATGNVKRTGAEGPIREVVSSRHIYVYGTNDRPAPEELQRRRDMATQAANWSTPRRRVMVFPRAVADRDVRPSDLESSNLVLFGTKETNSLIERFSDRLPIQLTATAADYGLVYIYPIGEHLVLINSGAPWWQVGPAPPTREGPFPPAPFAALSSLKDYVLFKGALGTKVLEGRFDGHWRLPASDAQELKASGAVTLIESPEARIGARPVAEP